MAKQRYYLDTRVLAAFFFAAMPFVAFGSFVVVNMAKTRLRESVGASLEQRAVQTKLGIEQYLAELATTLHLVALEPGLQEALAHPASLPSAADMIQLERDWVSGKDPALVAKVFSTPLAARLRTLAGVRPAIRQLQVIDRNGRTVAASARGGRLFYSDATWFKALSSPDAGPEPHVGDIEQPRGSNVTVLSMTYPVRDQEGARLGALRMLLDANDLYTVLAPVRVGRTGHAVLLRATDGLVLASDESERILKTTYPGFDSLRNALEGFPIGESGQALFGRSRLQHGYWTIAELKGVEPARVVGFSPIDQASDVNWLVVVEQDLSEAVAPIQMVTRFLWIHFIGVFATVILLALYFSFMLERPVMEEKLHLHEQHLPAGTRADVEG
jgi:hypothetical protein